ncbi:MAG: hypothetical protein ACREEP_05000 [Dongiaceae bacterium]
MSEPAEPAPLPPLQRFGPALLALGWGFALWALSPIIAGTREPWDAAWPLYSLAMVFGGAAGGWWLPRRPVSAYLGLWLGQVLALSLLPGRDLGWLPLGLVTTAIGALIGLGAYLAGWLARHAWQRFADRP